MSMLRRLLPVLAAGTLSGCFLWSSSTPVNKPTPLAAIQQTAGVEVLWRARPGAMDRAVLRPAVLGSSVFAAAADGTVVRWDGGREVWNVRPVRGLLNGVAAGEDTVLIASASGELVALSADKGQTRWAVPLAGEMTATPLIANGMAIVRVGDNQVLAFNLADGKRRWIYQRAQAPLILRAYSGFAVSGDLVLAGFSGGKLVALTLAAGFPRWEATVAQPRGSNELERMADIVGEPVVRGASACVAAFQGRVACVDRQSGAVQWTRDIASASGVDADERNVYVTDEDGNIHALDLRTGASAWKQDKLLYRGVGRPMVAGKYLVTGDAAGFLHVLDRADGRFVGRAELGAALRAPMASFAQGFVAQTADGRLHALGLR